MFGFVACPEPCFGRDLINVMVSAGDKCGNLGLVWWQKKMAVEICMRWPNGQMACTCLAPLSNCDSGAKRVYVLSKQVLLTAPAFSDGE